MNLRLWSTAAALCFLPLLAPAQQPDTFSRKNTFTLFAEFANDSSHIVAGNTRNRKLADLGLGYSRRLLHLHSSDLSYHVEVRPVLFESDPVAVEQYSTAVVSGPGTGQTYSDTSTFSVLRCVPGQITGSTTVPLPGYSSTYSITTTCGRQWTFGQAFTPFGFKYSMRTTHALQPYIIGTLGYMYTSRPVPLDDAEAFNFTIDAGAGVELYRSHHGMGKRSVALEARVHHFSNHNTAAENPGTDSIVYQVAYSFGR